MTIVTVPVRWLVGLAALGTLPWILMAAAALVPSAPAPTRGTGSSPPLRPAPPPVTGPWGALILTPLVISPPLEYVAADRGRNAPPAWVFPEGSSDALRAYLLSIGFTASEWARIAPAARFDPAIGGMAVTPPPDLVRSLSPTVRQRLYTRLATSLLNYDHAQSFRFFGSSPSDWFDGATISDETRRQIEPLVYADGPLLHFADIEAIRPLIASPVERQRLIKALLRHATLLVQVRVDTFEDAAILSEYWGLGGRRLDVRPLLESVAADPEAGPLDVTHLLPGFARDRLYRFPKLTSGDLARPLLANCLWTALNFFEDRPDDRYLDVEFALATLRARYTPVAASDRQFGDLVTMTDERGTLFHVAVHLADGLLFTKNGESGLAPWTIMTTDDVIAFYRPISPQPQLHYRRRSGS
jgi:hypothetical protein